MPTTGADAGAAGRIETARLCLRRPGPGDADAIVRYAGDHDVADMTAGIPHPYTHAHAATWLESSAAQAWVRAIFLKADDGFMGVVSITPVRSRADHWELGFWLGKPFWGHGYMTEAAAGLIGAYFDATGAGAVQSSAFVGNAASLRVQEKLNFRRVGDMRGYSPVREETRELVVTELKREAFRP